MKKYVIYPIIRLIWIVLLLPFLMLLMVTFAVGFLLSVVVGSICFIFGSELDMWECSDYVESFVECAGTGYFAIIPWLRNDLEEGDDEEDEEEEDDDAELLRPKY